MIWKSVISISFTIRKTWGTYKSFWVRMIHWTIAHQLWKKQMRTKQIELVPYDQVKKKLFSRISQVDMQPQVRRRSRSSTSSFLFVSKYPRRTTWILCADETFTMDTSQEPSTPRRAVALAAETDVDEFMRELHIAEREVFQHSEKHIDFQIYCVEQQRTKTAIKAIRKETERNSWRTHVKKLCLGCHPNAQPYPVISILVLKGESYATLQNISGYPMSNMRQAFGSARVSLAGWALKVLVRKNYFQLDEDERKVTGKLPSVVKKSKPVKEIGTVNQNDWGSHKCI